MKEAIILAGGFGTRLKHIVSDVPKPMAAINGTPFLVFLLRKLQAAGVERIIFSTGYLHEKIERYFGTRFENLQITYSQESEPLFTGGAIKLALEKAESNDVLVLNGDTLFDIDFGQFEKFYFEKKCNLAVALRKVKDTSRYGSVLTNERQKIIAFAEKNQSSGEGFINGGIYILNKRYLTDKELSIKFSFEKEILEKRYLTDNFFGLPFDNYFIDIGVPEDYARAQMELQKYDSLFLDRDGVINRQIIGGYVTKSAAFEFLPGVLSALKMLAKKFKYIFVVTNQQGIGKGIFTEEDLMEIHRFMLAEIEKAGGRIDKIYFCPALESENSINRKPGIGMALQAKRDFPDIDLARSVMVGDSESDMQFGKNAGMKTIYLQKSAEYENLLQFAEKII